MILDDLDRWWTARQNAGGFEQWRARFPTENE
jgi:hypothetical protein